MDSPHGPCKPKVQVRFLLLKSAYVPSCQRRLTRGAMGAYLLELQLRRVEFVHDGSNSKEIMSISITRTNDNTNSSCSVSVGSK